MVVGLGVCLAACGGQEPRSSTACYSPLGHGSMGVSQKCRPALFRLNRAAPPGQTGIDLSNNDPVYGANNWQTIRHHASFVYLKVSEGTRFIDQTARRMGVEARHAGLFVGAYDFLHVCGTNPRAEAIYFIGAAENFELLKGVGILPPTADFEYGSGCNANTWLKEWSNTVHRLSRDMVYSDPGYYIPQAGCFTQADYGWVADLGAYQPLCKLPTVFHQYSFSAWDGVSRVDGDVFRGSYAQLRALAGFKPHPHPCSRRCELRRLYAQRSELRRDLTHRRCRVIHGRRAYKLCPRWAREGRLVNRQIRSLGGR